MVDVKITTWGRPLTPIKLKLLQAVAAEPGQTTPYLAKITGVSVTATYKFLCDLAGKKLIDARSHPENRYWKAWYISEIGLRIILV